MSLKCVVSVWEGMIVEVQDYPLNTITHTIIHTRLIWAWMGQAGGKINYKVNNSSISYHHFWSCLNGNECEIWNGWVGWFSEHCSFYSARLKVHIRELYNTDRFVKLSLTHCWDRLETLWDFELFLSGNIGKNKNHCAQSSQIEFNKIFLRRYISDQRSTLTISKNWKWSIWHILKPYDKFVSGKIFPDNASQSFDGEEIMTHIFTCLSHTASDALWLLLLCFCA